jgi:hypothetical protein
MKHRRPDKLDVIAVLVVVAIVTIADIVARQFGGAEHPLLLCAGIGILSVVLMLCANWLTRQG